jgi:hypothetical protein
VPDVSPSFTPIVIVLERVSLGIKGELILATIDRLPHAMSWIIANRIMKRLQRSAKWASYHLNRSLVKAVLFIRTGHLVSPQP